jgi:hypothetical protein
VRTALLVLLAACHELPDLGICGNGIIEAENGEACDGGEGCTEACVLACQTSPLDGYVAVGVDLAGAELFCPDASYGCGVDLVCRAPSGMFQLIGESHPFDVLKAEVGDFDADRVDDLVGASTSKLLVRFGSSVGAPFVDGLAQDAPESLAEPVVFERALAEVDRSNLAIGIPTEGIALLTSDGTTFTSVLEGSFDLAGDNAKRIVVTDTKFGLGDIVIAIANGEDNRLVRRIALPSVDDLGLGPCGAPGLPHVVAVASDRKRFLVVGTGAPDRWLACEYAGDAAAETGFTRTATPIDGKPPSSIAFANLDDDACEELVTSRFEGADTVIEIVDATGPDCRPVRTPLALNGGTLAGLHATVLASGAIVPGGNDEVVLSSGLYEIREGNLERRVAPSSRAWSAAGVIDLDGDGGLDVVAGRVGAEDKVQEDVDVIAGSRAPTPYLADTAAPVIAVVTGHFDLGPLGDAALVEKNNQGHRVALLFGTDDGKVGPARPNSDFRGPLIELARLERFAWAPGSGDDAIDDLFLALHPKANEVMIRGGVLVGDPSRLLTMPNMPSSPDGVIGALAIGAFDGTNLAAVAVSDTRRTVLDIATGTYSDDALDFTVDATAGAQLLRTAGTPVIAVFSPPVIRAFDVGGTCAGAPEGEGLLHAVDIDADGLDELALIESTTDGRRARVFAITGGPSCAIGDELLVAALDGCGDVARAGSTLVTACLVNGQIDLYRIVDGVREARSVATLGGSSPRLVGGDFDGDGVPDVALGFGLRGEGQTQFVRQCPAHDTRGCR